MSVRIITGDCRDVLPTLPSDHFDCVVTSPPYYGLRDYQVEGQIGLEPTLALYLETMVGVCREVRRVLKPSGTFWLNIGDSFAGNGAGWRENNAVRTTLTGGKSTSKQQNRNGNGRNGMNPKDLMMVPNRLAILLQDDGWYVRSEIIWHKPNPMPESVTDRPTCAHEKVWLLTKSAKYYFDADAIREPLARTWDDSNGGSLSHGVGSKERVAQRGKSGSHSGEYPKPNPLGANSRNVWSIASTPFRGAHYAVMPSTLAERCIKSGSPVGGSVLDPFGGAGTTGLVADRLGRNATLIELNPANRELGAERVRMDGPLFAEVDA